MQYSVVFLFFLSLSLVSSQNLTDPYNYDGDQTEQVVNNTITYVYSDESEADVPTYHRVYYYFILDYSIICFINFIFTLKEWQTDMLITDGQCSQAGNVTWHVGGNICNGTSYQSCMPDWDGIIHYKVMRDIFHFFY